MKFAAILIAGATLALAEPAMAEGAGDRPTAPVVVDGATATFELDEGQRLRHSWGLFRDRRPDLYGPLLTFDGTTTP